MVVEITASSGNYMDSIVVSDVDEITEFLDGFVGSADTLGLPSTLAYLSVEGDVHGSETVLWGVANGVSTSWRSIQAA
jgi:hypothetical protein